MTQSADIMDNLNMDKLARDLPLDTFRLPPDFLISLEERKRMEVAKQEAAVGQQMLQSAEPITKSIKNLADAGIGV